MTDRWTLQAITAGVLAALSDLLAQRLSGSKPTNWRRAAAVGVRAFCSIMLATVTTRVQWCLC